jgi:hypothetical protein
MDFGNLKPLPEGPSGAEAGRSQGILHDFFRQKLGDECLDTQTSRD